MILYGPPGTGKTTLARLVSQATGRRFEALSALSSGVKKVGAVIDTARRRLGREGGQATVLFIDETQLQPLSDDERLPNLRRIVRGG